MQLGFYSPESRLQIQCLPLYQEESGSPGLKRHMKRHPALQVRLDDSTVETISNHHLGEIFIVMFHTKY